MLSFHQLWLAAFVSAASVASAASAAATSQPSNIVLILTDDLDLTLGGAASLVKTKRLLAAEGAEVPNWFVHTPVCYPSRAELLTGRMFRAYCGVKPVEMYCGLLRASPSPSSFSSPTH